MVVLEGQGRKLVINSTRNPRGDFVDEFGKSWYCLLNYGKVINKFKVVTHSG